MTGRGDGILLAKDAACPPAGKREGNHMKKDVGLALYGLLGLLLAPAATWLGERAAYLAAQGLTSGLWLASSAHLLIYILLGAYLALYVAFSSVSYTHLDV